MCLLIENLIRIIFRWILYLYLFLIGCFRFGVYGNNCDKLCIDNCLEFKCNILNGVCFNCGFGWKGEFCKEGKINICVRFVYCVWYFVYFLIKYFYIVCFFGYYGEKCMEKCEGYCYKSKFCNYINGLCDNGCLDGWIGGNCSKCKKFKMCL